MHNSNQCGSPSCGVIGGLSFGFEVLVMPTGRSLASLPYQQNLEFQSPQKKP